MDEIQRTIGLLAVDQKRIAQLIENIKNDNAPIPTPSRRSSSHSSSFKSEVFESAVSFVPITGSHMPILKKPSHILDLSTVTAESIQNYNISHDELEVDEDHPSIRYQRNFDIYTASLRIIGIPTNKPSLFISLLFSRNKWLKIKYLHIDRVYQTERSYLNSYNYVVTMDKEAHKLCLDFGVLHSGKGHCKIFDHREDLHCTRCQSLTHLLDDCNNDVVCKLCAKNHHHTTCTAEPNKHACTNCLKANENGANFATDHSSSYGGCGNRKPLLQPARFVPWLP